MFGENRRVERSPAYRYRLAEGGNHTEGIEEEDSNYLSCTPTSEIQVTFSDTVQVNSTIETLIVVDQAHLLSAHEYKKLLNVSKDGQVSYAAQWSVNDNHLSLCWVDESNKVGLCLYSSTQPSYSYGESNTQSKLQLSSKLLKDISIQNLVIVGGISKTESIISMKYAATTTFCLHSSGSENRLNLKYPEMPSPNLVQGLAAAIFTQAEFNRIPSTLIINRYQLASELQNLSRVTLYSILDQLSANTKDLSLLIGNRFTKKNSFSQPFGLIFT